MWHGWRWLRLFALTQRSRHDPRDGFVLVDSMTTEEAPQDRWKQRGIISLWRYTENSRNHSGWHFSADAPGCESLLELLRALMASPESAYRTVQVSPPSPTALKVPNFRSKWVAPTKWRIAFEPIKESTSLWNMETQEDSVNLTLGGAMIQELASGVMDIGRGEGDYSIGGSDRQSRLWFWWWLDDVS